MLHLLYILVFAILAFLAIGNLIRNLINLGLESQRQTGGWSTTPKRSQSSQLTPHPELLNADGQIVNEPLLVMRSMPIDELRTTLDKLYNASPDGSPQRDRSEEA